VSDPAGFLSGRKSGRPKINPVLPDKSLRSSHEFIAMEPEAIRGRGALVEAIRAYRMFQAQNPIIGLNH